MVIKKFTSFFSLIYFLFQFILNLIYFFDSIYFESYLILSFIFRFWGILLICQFLENKMLDIIEFQDMPFDLKVKFKIEWFNIKKVEFEMVCINE